MDSTISGLSQMSETEKRYRMKIGAMMLLAECQRDLAHVLAQGARDDLVGGSKAGGIAIGLERAAALMRGHADTTPLCNVLTEARRLAGQDAALKEALNKYATHRSTGRANKWEGFVCVGNPKTFETLRDAMFDYDYNQVTHALEIRDVREFFAVRTFRGEHDDDEFMEFQSKEAAYAFCYEERG